MTQRACFAVSVSRSHSHLNSLNKTCTFPIWMKRSMHSSFHFLAVSVSICLFIFCPHIYHYIFSFSVYSFIALFFHFLSIYPPSHLSIFHFCLSVHLIYLLFPSTFLQLLYSFFPIHFKCCNSSFPTHNPSIHPSILPLEPGPSCHTHRAPSSGWPWP